MGPKNLVHPGLASQPNAASQPCTHLPGDPCGSNGASNRLSAVPPTPRWSRFCSGRLCMPSWMVRSRYVVANQVAAFLTCGEAARAASRQSVACAADGADAAPVEAWVSTVARSAPRQIYVSLSAHSTYASLDPACYQVRIGDIARKYEPTRWWRCGCRDSSRGSLWPTRGSGRYCGAQPSWLRYVGGGRTRNVVILVVTDDEGEPWPSS